MAQIIKLIINTSYTFDEGNDGGMYTSEATYDINTSTITITEENHEDVQLPLDCETTEHTLDLGGVEYCLKEKEGSSSEVLIFCSLVDEAAALAYIFDEAQLGIFDGDISVTVAVQPADLLRLDQDAFYSMIDEAVVKQFPHVTSASVMEAELTYGSVPGENGYSETVIKAELLDFVLEID